MSIIKQFEKPKTVFVLLILILVLMLQESLVTAETQTPDEPTGVTAAPTWNSLQNLTNNTNGSRSAVVRGAPNGRTVIVGYLRQMSGTVEDTDVYYRRSTTNGAPGGWSDEARIHSSAGVRSAELDIDYDSANKAHAVWVENELELHYAGEASWASNASTIRSTSATGLDSPRIIASGSNNLDIVWAEYNNFQWQIFHTRSKNGGSSWAVPKNLVSVGSADFSGRPTLAVNGNIIHVAWEEGVFSQKIMYSQGTVNTSTNTVSWTTSRAISNASAATAAKQPQLILVGNTVHVAYTERFSETQQYIHHIQCSSNCTSSNVNANWLSQGNPISGQVLGVSATDPYDLVATMDQQGACTFVYFHGRLTTNDNEQVWGTNSCGNWAASAKDEVTDGSVRTIHPNIEVHNNWWIYLVYEEFVSADVRQIRFLRSKPALYLPLIVK